MEKELPPCKKREKQEKCRALLSNFSCLSALPKSCTIKNSQEHHNNWCFPRRKKINKSKPFSSSMAKKGKASPVAGVGVWCGENGCAKGAPGFSWGGSGSIRAVEPFARRESPRLSLSSSRASSIARGGEESSSKLGWQRSVELSNQG